jgi:sigma-B regulation protein RsbU (phosphoserine phosphatase)
MDDRPELVIVDDEFRVYQSLEREIKLEFGEGLFGISCFARPAEALARVRERNASVFLVISDLRMPEMSGSDFLSIVGSECPDIQKILLTAYSDMEGIQRAVSSSIQSLMFKPWTRERLLSEVGKALSIWSLRRENERLRGHLDRLLSDAGDFQRRLFSQAMPQSDALSVDVFFSPLESFHCGGDFYDIFKLGGDDFLFILGDVAGHGPKSAIVASMFKTALHSVIESEEGLSRSPAQLLKRLNDHFCSIFSCAPELLVALSAIYVCPAEARLVAATAGLPPFAFIRAGAVEFVSSRNPVLGALPGNLYAEESREFIEGDQVVAFTDGLVECPARFFNMEQGAVAELLRSNAGKSARDIAAAFAASLPDEACTDDVTVLCLRARGK